MAGTATKTLKVVIAGSASGLTKASGEATVSLGKVGKAGQSIGGRMQGVAQKTKEATSSIAGFASDSISAYKNVATETLQMARYTGMSTEEASRLRYIAQQTGTDVAVLGKGFGAFNKNLVANSKAFQELGIQGRDAKGNLRPMTELLPEISDKFKKMPNGPAKTALAMKLFGKAGVALIPMLSKGSSGMKELAKESDDLGFTLKDQSVDGMKASTAAARKFKAMSESLKVQLGGALIPILAVMAGFFVQHIMPVIQKVTKFFQEHTTITKILVGALVGFVAISKTVGIGLKLWAIGAKLVAIASKAWAAVQVVLNLVLSANPIGLIVLGIAALIAIIVICYKKFGWFRDIIQKVWAVIKTVFVVYITAIKLYFLFWWNAILIAIKVIWWAIKNVLIDPIIWVYNRLKTVIGWIWAAMKAGFTAVKEVLKVAWEGVKAVFWTPLKWVFDKVKWFVNQAGIWIGKIPDFFVGIWDGLQQGFVDAVNTLIDVYNNTAAAIPGVDEIEHMEGPEDRRKRAQGEVDKAIEGWKSRHPGQEIPADVVSKYKKIYGAANGGVVTRAGRVLVGERGPEVVSLGRGAQVIPLPARGGAGAGLSVVVNVTGSVIAERDLHESIVSAIRKGVQRNGGSAAYLGVSR